MIPVRSDVRIWLATGCTDMRRGMFGLALQVQQGLQRDPHAGDLYIFRGRRGDLVKVLWHDGVGGGAKAPTTRSIVGRFRRDVALCKAARPQAVHMACGDRRRGRDHSLADGMPAGSDRLAQPAHDVASANGWMS